MASNAYKGTALITGASSGIGAVYADRLARRGHDLILVARNGERLHALANHLSDAAGRAVETVVADLANIADLARVETVLRTDASITILVNNAGVGSAGSLLDSDVDRMSDMIALNVGAVARLTYAVVPGFVARGTGTIVNIASIAALAPELLSGVYGGSKAFVLAFSQSLHHELAAKGIRLQAVLPGATATEFWDVDYAAEDRDAVVSAYPRTGQFKEDIIEAFYDGIRHKPGTTFGNVKADVMADKEPHFRRGNFCDVIRKSGWES